MQCIFCWHCCIISTAEDQYQGIRVLFYLAYCSHYHNDVCLGIRGLFILWNANILAFLYTLIISKNILYFFKSLNPSQYPKTFISLVGSPIGTGACSRLTHSDSTPSLTQTVISPPTHPLFFPPIEFIAWNCSIPLIFHIPPIFHQAVYISVFPGHQFPKLCSETWTFVHGFTQAGCFVPAVLHSGGWAITSHHASNPNSYSEIDINIIIKS